MGQVMGYHDANGTRVQEARDLYFGRGDTPSELVDQTILHSWDRCRRAGLDIGSSSKGEGILGSDVLREGRDRNYQLIAHSSAVMEHLYEQIRHTGSMVLLADADGLLLHSLGDPEFVDRANRVLLQPGALWDESSRGTNAVGTALIEERPVEVYGAEHFLLKNSFLTCSAAPLMDPRGRLLGVLDISCDYRAYQRHTMGLVRMSAEIIERRLFEAEHAGDILICFHHRAEFLGTLGDGLMALSAEGRILGVNRSALDITGMRREELVGRDFSTVFSTSLGQMMERLRVAGTPAASFFTYGGKEFKARLRGDLPRVTSVSTLGNAGLVSTSSRQTRPAAAKAAQPVMTLECLLTGDPRMQAAVTKACRILGRDIPVLIQGESGAGKEMFAKAFHNSGPRASGPFIALNCAAIPETLIESELFGYTGGAFTGARKEGAIGKIQQAHGGTLFLDEIGDMPLHMQARLLRVLQERVVTPLGSGKTTVVDISLVCATHRRLRDEVARGSFREDLYYRLNGLSVTLPALRERTDLEELAYKLVSAEAAGRPVGVSCAAMNAIKAYPWPGNIRQLNNVIRVALALLDDDENIIDVDHLPEELTETPIDMVPVLMTTPAQDSGGGVTGVTGTGSPASLEMIEREAIVKTLEAMDGNISAAARKLGISRNTLYRKLGRL